MKLTLLWLVLGAAVSIRAADLAPSDEQQQIQQQETRQEQIKASTRRIAEQLDSLIAEFQRNGIAGDDVKILSGIRSVLGRLSEKDMARVVVLLQQAREKTDATSRQKVTAAYSGQKGIILQLRHLLLEFQRQQALQDLAARFEELANKQTLNLKEASSLADLKASARRNVSNERQALSLQLQEIQQTAIRDESEVTLNLAQKIIRDGEGDIAATASTVVQKAQNEQLLPGLAQAVKDLKDVALNRALESETKSRDLLRELARMLGHRVEPTEALHDAMAQLDELVEQEKALLGMTRQLGKTVRDSQPLQDRQGEITDKTEMLRQDLKGLVGDAPQFLENAATKMKEARAALGQRQSSQQKRDAAIPKETEALAQLMNAKKNLQDQLARADNIQKKPADPFNTATNLLAQVRDLKDQQQKVRDNSNATTDPESPKKEAPQQAKVKKQTARVQDQAALTLPEVAKSLAQAATAMSEAEKKMNEGADPDKPQQAAMEALAKAETELSGNVNKLAQARQDLEKLADLSKDLGTVIQQQQELQKETAKAAAQKKEIAPLASQQQQAKEKTAQLQQKAGKAAPQSAQNLSHAVQNMGDAKKQMDQNSTARAQESEQQALDDLYEAKGNLEDKINELAKSLAQPRPPNPLDLAQAAKAIEQAQNQVSSAMDKLQPPPNALQQLQKEQQTLASAIQAQAAKPEAGLPKTAPDSAQNAANQLAKPNLSQAIAEMKKSEQALNEAKTSPPANAEGGATQSSQLAEKQTELKKRAEALASSKPGEAVPSLENAAGLVGPLAAGKAGPLPSAAQDALQSAQSALAEASAQAAANQGQPAQAEASNAQESLAQAAAALAMAQQGMGNEGKQASAKNQGKGKQPGKGKTPGEGKEGESSSNQNHPELAKAGSAEAPRRTVQGAGKFIGLPKRDRAAIQQSQAEKYPAEYGAAIEQYLRNLSEETSDHASSNAK